MSVQLLGRAEPIPAGASVRLAVATGLPWTLAVASFTPERELREFRARRRLFTLMMDPAGKRIAWTAKSTTSEVWALENLLPK